MTLNERVDEAIRHWPHVAPLLTPVRDRADYEALVAALDRVLDAGGAEEDNPLARLADYLGELLAEWEAADDMPPAAIGVEVLRHLLTERGLRQSDLPEIGSQGVVSEILAGKRALNLRQIRALAARFGVPERMFL